MSINSKLENKENWEKERLKSCNSKPLCNDKNNSKHDKSLEIPSEDQGRRDNTRHVPEFFNFLFLTAKPQWPCG